MLTADDYDAIKAGTIDVAALNANNLASATSDNTINNIALSLDDFIQVLSSNITTTFDEIKYGTSATDVIAVAAPEPASLSLISLTGLALLLRRRH